MRKKLLVIDNAYPNENNLYGDVFVHTRVKEYQKHHDCLIISFDAETSFEYEGVSVIACKTAEDFKKVYDGYEPDLVLIHFLSKWMIENLMTTINTPLFVWVHGFEALSWKRRLFNYSIGGILNKNFLKMVRENRAQLKAFGDFVNRSNKTGRPVHFIFVSKWMKKICETDTGARLQHFSIIPNPIDTKLFSYKEKQPELAHKLLSIRPFHSRKYANDITMYALLQASAESWFKDVEVNIYGDGPFFSDMQSKLSHLSNVRMHRGFLTQSRIKELHDQHGIFLCPTRQDAQGVSMCEAMSSGLVPLTSNNTAIPEFVKDGRSGFTTSGSKDLAKRIGELVNNGAAFRKMSAEAARSIAELSSLQSVTTKELELFITQKQGFRTLQKQIHG